MKFLIYFIEGLIKSYYIFYKNKSVCILAFHAQLANIV